MTRLPSWLHVRLRALALAAAACGVALPALAQDGGVLSGTLKAVRDRGSIRIGFRDSAPPFSFLNAGGQPIGFSIDLCRAIAGQAAARFGLDLLEPDAPAWQKGVRIAFVPVAADARLPKLVSGEIDLECGSTTANAERARTIAFSPVFFLAGTKLMVPRASTAASYRELAGRTVVVGGGTTNAAVLHRLAAGTSPPIVVAEVANLNDAYDQLVAGKADAFASDDVLLAGLVATRPGGTAYRITGDYLSFEPYAIGLRRDDPDFADLVRRSFEQAAAAGMLTARYNRWFVSQLPTGQTLNLPISPQLSEMFRALGQPD